MRKEIGSEFWEVPVAGDNGMFNGAIWFASGRSALYAIVRENSFKTVAMPEWCCGTMIKPFTDHGVRVKFYSRQDAIRDMDTDAVLVMDYFGYTGHSDCEGYKGVVIRDLTHSIFSASYNDADYYFGSLRKWAGFYTGGFAKGLKNPPRYDGDVVDYCALRKEAMQKKQAYISGDIDSKAYLEIFAEAEEFLEIPGVFPADEADVIRAKTMDVDFVRRQRKNNASVLLEAFSDIAVFPDMKETDCPLFVPILVDNRDALRRYLIQNEIYCPAHWPKSAYHQLSDVAESFYDRELSLVCDQRYTEQDMTRMVCAVHDFLDKEV